MNSIHYLKDLDDPEENRKMLPKLPRYLADHWSREVDKRLYDSDGKHDSTSVDFSEAWIA
jgi:hypothetical protein